LFLNNCTFENLVRPRRLYTLLAQTDRPQYKTLAMILSSTASTEHVATESIYW